MSIAEGLEQFIAARRRWRDLRGPSLETFQEARARQLLPWVRARSGFYREHWDGCDLNDWRHLPTVDKSLMMAQFDRFNTAGISRAAALEVAQRAETERDFASTLRAGSTTYTVGLSSGTSGRRGLFLVSPAEQSAWAGLILARALHRSVLASLWRGERIAFFLRSNSQLYERLGTGPLRFRYFDLMTPISESLRQLEALNPSILVAPPSMLLALADGGPRIAPHSVFAVAEVLEDQDRALLEEAFQVPLQQIYQATEGLIAVTCRAGRLHLQEDLMAVQLEPLVGDASGSRFTPILTDLWRRTQPIIRYRLNDVLRLESRPCPCGNPWRVIRQIEGRSDDIPEFRSDGGKVLLFPDTLRRAVLGCADVLEYEAVQSEPGQLSVRLEVTPGRETSTVSAVQGSLSRELARFGIAGARLEVRVGIPARPANQKRRRVRCEPGAS